MFRRRTHLHLLGGCCKHLLERVHQGLGKFATKADAHDWLGRFLMRTRRPGRLAQGEGQGDAVIASRNGETVRIEIGIVSHSTSSVTVRNDTVATSKDSAVIRDKYAPPVTHERADTFDPPLDAGIARAVGVLRAAGV